MYKHYVARLKYHLWRLSRAAEFVLRPEEKTQRAYIKEMQSVDLMKATLDHLNRLNPKDAKVDHNPYKCVGVIPHDWEKRINERIQKENNNAVD